MQSFVECEAERLINGAMAGYAIGASELFGSYPDSEMGLAGFRRFFIMAGMQAAFVDNFEI